MGLTPLLALLMVSRVEYRSFKRIKRTSFFFLVCLIGIVFLIASQPEITLFAIGVVYISAGLIRWFIKSPEKIRNLAAFLLQMYHERKESFIYDDAEDD